MSPALNTVTSSLSGAISQPAKSRPIVLDCVDPAAFPGWNELVLSHPDGSFFHSREWMRVLAETYGLKPCGLLFRDGRDALQRVPEFPTWNGDAVERVPTGLERPVALIPFLEKRGLFGGRRAISLPFTDFCEPLLWAPVDRNRVWEELAGFARSRGWRSFELRGGQELASSGPPSLTFFGHTLELTPDEDELFQRFEGAVRRAIRKAERDGVTAEVSESAEAVESYYELHCATRKRHGLPPQPFRMFEKIHEHVLANRLGFVVTARHQGRPVAAAMFFRFGRHGLFKFGASARAFQGLRGNNLVMWLGIRQLARQGCGRLHFGRTSRAGEGLRRFKRGWGTREHEIRYVRFDLSKSCFLRDQDRAYGWYNRVFEFTPSCLSRLIGSLFYGQTA